MNLVLHDNNRINVTVFFWVKKSILVRISLKNASNRLLRPDANLGDTAKGCKLNEYDNVYIQHNHLFVLRMQQTSLQITRTTLF